MTMTVCSRGKEDTEEKMSEAVPDRNVMLGGDEGERVDAGVVVDEADEESEDTRDE